MTETLDGSPAGMPADEGFADVNEGAKILGVHVKTMQRYLREGMFPEAFRLHGDTGEWRIPRKRLLRLPDSLPPGFQPNSEQESPAVSGEKETT